MGTDPTVESEGGGIRPFVHMETENESYNDLNINYKGEKSLDVVALPKLTAVRKEIKKM